MSKYSDKIFKVDLKKGTLEINKKEARQIDAYKALIERDKGGKVEGDFDGRKKLFARKELLYMYIMGDEFTMYSVLNKELRHVRGLELSGLKHFPNWKPDKLVKEAIKQYKEDLNLSPIGFTYINTKKALYNIGKDIELYEDMNYGLRIEIYELKGEIKNAETEEDKQKSKSKLKSCLKDLNSNNKEILNITSTLPDRLESMDKLKVKLSDEDNERDAVIGGGSTYSREDPN